MDGSNAAEAGTMVRRGSKVLSKIMSVGLKSNLRARSIMQMFPKCFL